jgi:hypothetical protein
MTLPDLYSPEVIKHERNGGFKTMSQSTHSDTESEGDVYAILNRLVREYALPAGRPPRFCFEAQRWTKIPGVFDSKNRPVWYKPDVIVGGTLYGDGIIRVQGGIHRTPREIRVNGRTNPHDITNDCKRAQESEIG